MANRTNAWFPRIILWKKARRTIYSKIAVIYLVTFLIVLPIICRDIKYSLFYIRPDLEEARIRELDLNAKRIQDAQTFHTFLDTSDVIPSVHNASFSSNIDIVISIITQSRKTDKKDKHAWKANGTMYLTQTVVHMLKLLQDLKKPSSVFPYTVKLQMCNIDVNMETFSEAKDMQRYLPMIARFPDGNKINSNVSLLEKEKQDYVFCLSHSVEQDRPRYVLVIEDDTLPNPNFFPVLKRTLDYHLEKSFLRGSFAAKSRQDIAYVKFYHPDRLLGYISIDPERLTELFGLASVCGIIVVSVFRTPWNKSVNAFIGWIVYFALLFLVLGRAHVNSIRNFASPYLHSFSPAPSCCTPAVLFPRIGGQEVVRFLNSTTCKKGYAKDSALDTFIKTTHFKAYIVQPSAFTHIGMYSSLRHNIIHPSNLQSFKKYEFN